MGKDAEAIAKTRERLLHERLTDAAFDQEGGARLAADDDFPAVELQPRQKQQVALDWASEREAAVVKSLAL